MKCQSDNIKTFGIQNLTVRFQRCPELISALKCWNKMLKNKFVYFFQIRTAWNPASNPRGEEALSPDLQGEGGEVPQGQRHEKNPQGGKVQDRRNQLQPLQEVEGKVEAHRSSALQRKAIKSTKNFRRKIKKETAKSRQN